MSAAAKPPCGAAVKERPILFSAPMVRALLAGTKTQTRRIIKPQPHRVEAHDEVIGRDVHTGELLTCHVPDGWARKSLYAADKEGGSFAKHLAWDCPYGYPVKGLPPPRLYVRETWVEVDSDDPPPVYAYRADDPDPNSISRWRPSIHMPRRASRLLLEVTEVRAQRLQDISEDDARAEGVDPVGDAGPIGYVDQYARLWDAINGKRRVRVPKGWPSLCYTTKPDLSCSWEANPWVWAITFRRAA